MAKGTDSNRPATFYARGALGRRNQAGAAKVFRVGGLDFVKDHNAAGHGDVVVMADPAKLDALWQRTGPGWAIPRGGGGAEMAGKREEFARFLTKPDRPPIEMSRVVVSKVNGQHQADFINGRHRFSALRDQGRAVVPVTVPRSQAAKARRLFGA